MDPLTPDTPLARFSAGNDIRSEMRPRVKERFMQPRREVETGAWALSTSRVDGLNADAKRVFGADWVQAHLGPERSLKAHCELPVHAFEAQGLTAVFDDEPPRHVNVVGWSDEADARLAVAQELCALVEEAGAVVRYG